MKYLFSVVMAVYNTERYLREAVDSLIGQDIGFDRIQLILVDDGSKDASGAVCDEYAARYPDNVVVIHKENGGVSTARNAGLEQVQGKYVNFLDSDDRISPDTFSRVYSFFEAHEEETDVVSIPLYFFEGRTGPHGLNQKYERGSRIIDLRQDWTCIQMSGSSAFIRRECLETLRFQPALRYAEDAELLQKILLQKQTLGVVAEGAYYYRFRAGEEQSSIQSAAQNPAWYWPRLSFWFEETVSRCLREHGFVPKFIQYSLMHEIRWFVTTQSFPPDMISADDEPSFWARLFRLLSCFDDDVICATEYLSVELKLFLLTKKNGLIPRLNILDGNVLVLPDGVIVGPIEDLPVRIDFIRLEKDHCRIEANTLLLRVLDFPVSAFCGDAVFPAEPGASCTAGPFRKDRILTYQAFQISVPISPHSGTLSFRLGLAVQGRMVPLTCLFERYAPLSKRFRNGYYCHAGRYIQYRDGAFSVADERIGTHFLKELLFLWELLFGKHHQRKAALFRILYWLTLPWKRKPLWLISDRRIRAGDNGEAFFRYLRSEHPEIDARFILRKTAEAYPELNALGRVLENDSLKEKLLTLLSDYVISSQSAWNYYTPFEKTLDSFCDLMADRKFVFLQHGVTKDDISGWVNRRNMNFFGIVTSAQAEYRSFLDVPSYGFSEKEVWLTGMPRFDRLFSEDQPRQITIMPTWRRYLSGKVNAVQQTWDVTPDFSQSDYFRFYSALLSDERLLRAAAEHGYTIAFFPHPALQTYLDAFHFPPEIRLLGLDEEYRTVYAESALVVTDYSSAVFDFAYLEKPVLYAQFDKDRFFSDHGYRKGYFDYERDGFGEVEYDLASTVDRILEYMRSGCAMKPQYRQRVENFFAFRDRDNCRRLYERMTGS